VRVAADVRRLRTRLQINDGHKHHGTRLDNSCTVFSARASDHRTRSACARVATILPRVLCSTVDYLRSPHQRVCRHVSLHAVVFRRRRLYSPRRQIHPDGATLYSSFYEHRPTSYRLLPFHDLLSVAALALSDHTA